MPRSVCFECSVSQSRAGCAGNVLEPLEGTVASPHSPSIIFAFWAPGPCFNTRLVHPGGKERILTPPSHPLARKKGAFLSFEGCSRMETRSRVCQAGLAQHHEVPPAFLVNAGWVLINSPFAKKKKKKGGKKWFEHWVSQLCFPASFAKLCAKLFPAS